MSTFYEKKEKCAICGKSSVHTALSSTNCFGPSDLDLRPAPMQRNTMHTWITVCPHCGYASNDISSEMGEHKEHIKEIMESDSYNSCDGILFMSSLAKSFYREHLISKEVEAGSAPFISLRNAAWACDDAHDKESATKCRLLAIPYIDKLILERPDYSDTATLIKMDFLRRSGCFDKVINDFKDIKLGDSFLQSILEYEIKCAEAKDDKCHTVADV